MNVERRQVAADPQTKPVSCQSRHTHHRHLLLLLSPKAYSFCFPQRVEGWVNVGGWLHTERDRWITFSTAGVLSWFRTAACEQSISVINILWSGRDSVRPDRMRAGPSAGPEAGRGKHAGPGRRGRRTAAVRCRDGAASDRRGTSGEARRRRRVVVNPASASCDVAFRAGLIRNRGSEIRRQPTQVTNTIPDLYITYSRSKDKYVSLRTSTRRRPTSTSTWAVLGCKYKYVKSV